ncbi:hypothetical protein [Endozoicomonas sp. SCSIO W0465]|nr:hypothetical protein [Endozoicomonas sp. SCSIO W0465]
MTSSSVWVCAACNYEFPEKEKHNAEVFGAALLANQIEPEGWTL